MPFSLICHGCGYRLDIPDDYPRRKMRCPACGVMCEVPVPGKERAVATPVKSERAPSPEPPQDKPKAPDTDIILIPEAEPVYSLMEMETSQEDDGKPYAVAGGLPKPCPNCNRPLERDAKLCTSCGFDLVARKAPEKVYEPVEHESAPGMPFALRLKYFIASIIAFFMLGLVGTIASGEWLSFMLSWLTFSGMFVYLFGTYDRVNLTRDTRGKVRLLHAWRFCFVPFTSERVHLKDYEGVATGRIGEIGLAEWLIVGFLVLSGLLSMLNLVIDAFSADQIHWLAWLGMLFLLPLGFVPAVIAYFVFFHKISFYVALSDGHGHPRKFLYKGWSEEYMRDLAETVSKVTTLPLQGG